MRLTLPLCVVALGSFPCIYELEGDTLRVCYDLSGKKRPGEFKTAEGTQLYLVTYTRKKD